MIFISVLAGIIILTLLQRNQISIGYWFLQLGLYLCFIFTLVFAIYKAFKNRSRKIGFHRFGTVFFGAILIPAFFVASWLDDTDGGKTKLVSGGCFRDIYFIQFYLFGDSSFKILNSGAFGGPYYRGNYHLKGDTLRLENDSLRQLFPTLTFVMKTGVGNKKYFECTDTTTPRYPLEILDDNRR